MHNSSLPFYILVNATREVVVPPYPNVTLPYVPSWEWFSLELDISLITGGFVQTQTYELEIHTSITVITTQTGTKALDFTGDGTGEFEVLFLYWLPELSSSLPGLRLYFSIITQVAQAA